MMAHKSLVASWTRRPAVVVCQLLHRAKCYQLSEGDADVDETLSNGVYKYLVNISSKLLLDFPPLFPRSDNVGAPETFSSRSEKGTSPSEEKSCVVDNS